MHRLRRLWVLLLAAMTALFLAFPGWAAESTQPQHHAAILSRAVAPSTLYRLSQAHSGVQAKPVELRVTFGISQFFLDEPFPDHWLAGGSVRIYLTQRLSFEPELLYFRSIHGSLAQDYKRVAFIPNIVFDLTRAERRFRPYVIGGVGFIHSRDRRERGLPQGGWGRVSENGWTASAGLGVKVFLTERLFVSPEARVGLPLLRYTVSIGYVLARRK